MHRYVGQTYGCNSVAWIYGRLTPPDLQRYLEYHYSKLSRSTGRYIYIAQCTYTYGRLTPPPFFQSSVWKTITPNKFIYSTIHIYPWQIDPTPSSKIAENSAKPLHQTSFIYSTMHIYLWQIDTLQSSIHACSTAPPNQEHLMADIYI